MSETPAPDQQQKTKLGQLLEKVTAFLAAGAADADGILPGQPGHDATTSPGVGALWTASILRIFLLRVIEHIRETRLAFREVVEEMQKNRAHFKKHDEQIKDMEEMLRLIVSGGAKAPEASEEQAAAPPVEDGAEEGGEPTPAPSAHEQTLSELAASLARGEHPDLSKVADASVPTPVASPASPGGTVTPIAPKQQRAPGNNRSPKPPAA